MSTKSHIRSKIVIEVAEMTFHAAVRGSGINQIKRSLFEPVIPPVYKVYQ